MSMNSFALEMPEPFFEISSVLLSSSRVSDEQVNQLLDRRSRTVQRSRFRYDEEPSTERSTPVIARTSPSRIELRAKFLLSWTTYTSMGRSVFRKAVPGLFYLLTEAGVARPVFPNRLRC